MSRFICAGREEYDARQIDALCAGLNIQPLAARALIRRGLTNVSDADRFLHPQLLPLADPYDMPDMQKAVDRLRAAFLNDESICVYGDYDADGICATAILLDCFAGYTEKAFAYIPSRHGEGYGLHEEAVRRLHKQGAALIVTVDNGISAREEIALCRALGIDVIVTDHHAKPTLLPECVAVVTPSDGASGAGVALRLARALAGDRQLERWLPMAALATVADIVPLTGDNRALVAKGLPFIEENMGLCALLRASGNGENAVDATTLAFQLAPRLNAAGRLRDAMLGVSLLLAEDMYTAEARARELNELNTQRRAIEADILAEAQTMLDALPDPARHAVLLFHADWNVGVIGIVASRLCERLHCPVILFSEDASGILTGSGRSPENIDLYVMLTACAGHFIRFGGHAGAAGITMHKSAFEAFCEDFRACLAAHYTEEAFLPALCYDETAALDELTLSAVAELRLLAPFGEGNPEPVYRLCGITLTELKRIGQGGKHLSARACGGGASLRAVGFGFGERLDELRSHAGWTLLARPAVHSYRGMDSVELVLLDAQSDAKLFDDFLENVLYNNVCVENFDFPHAGALAPDAFDDDSMRRMYVALLDGIGARGCGTEELVARYSRRELCALAVFTELGFFVHGSGVVRRAPGAERRMLTESRLYRLLRSKDEREESSWT